MRKYAIVEVIRVNEKPLHATDDLESIPSSITEGEQTMLDRYRYANEKLTMAIYKLATGEGKIKDRLCESFIEIAILSDNDFPQELRANFRDILKTLTKKPPPYNYCDCQWET